MIKSEKLMEAAEQGNVALYREMKSTLSRNTGGQTAPESLDGKVTHDTILDRFRECYEQLYNSAGTEDAMTDIKKSPEEVIKANTGASLKEVDKVTWQVVKQASAECVLVRMMLVKFTPVMFFFMPLTLCFSILHQSLDLFSPMGQSAFRSSHVLFCLCSRVA